MPLPPPPTAITVGLKSLEIWTDVECNSGLRKAFIPHYTCEQITEHIELGGEDYLEITSPTTLAWASEVDHGRILRITYSDDAVREYRIRSIKRSRSGTSVLWTIRAVAIKYDLSPRLMEFDQANGLPLLHHELINITAEDMFDALFNLGTPIWPSYFAKGTIDTTSKYDIVWDWETILTALEEIATVTGLKLRIRRNGATNYLVDLLGDLSAGSEIPEIRYARNLLKLDYDEDTSKIGTLIYPKGEGAQGAAPTIADTRFYASGTDGTTGPWKLHAWDGAATSVDYYIINEDDQFNNFYLEHADGTLTQITDSVAELGGKRISLTLASSVSINGRIVRMSQGAKASGNLGMTFIPLPSAIAVYGEIPMILERLDIPGVTNLKGDPFLETYNAGANLEYSPDAGLTVTEISAPSEYIHYGTKCLKLEGDAGDGINITLGASSSWTQNRDDIVLNNPHLSFQTWMFVEVGQLEHFMQFTNAPNYSRWPPLGYTDPDTGEEIDSVKTDWIKSAADTPDGVKDPGNFFHLTLEPANVDFVENTPTDNPNPPAWYNSRITFRYVCLKDGTVVYLDAIQMVNHINIADKIVNGSNHLKLWDAAIRAFGVDGGPSVAEPRKEVRFDAVDLYRLDSATYQYDEILPGVQVRITDPEIVSGVLRTIQSVDRDLKTRAITKIELVEEQVDVS